MIRSMPWVGNLAMATRWNATGSHAIPSTTKSHVPRRRSRWRRAVTLRQPREYTTSHFVVRYNGVWRALPVRMAYICRNTSSPLLQEHHATVNDDHWCVLGVSQTMSNQRRSSTSPGSRRTLLEVITCVLRAAAEQRRHRLQTDGGFPVKKRDIMRSANVNHGQLTKCLAVLEEKCFVVKHESEDRLHLEITDKSEELLNRAGALTELLN